MLDSINMYVLVLVRTCLYSNLATVFTMILDSFVLHSIYMCGIPPSPPLQLVIWYHPVGAGDPGWHSLC